MEKDNKTEAARLRERAEDLLKLEPSETTSKLSEAEMRELIREFAVCQIGLESENKELRLAKEHAETSRKKSTELYDFAPIVTTNDIEERKLEEEALRESELKYRSLIESSSDAIFCVDEKGEYKFTNHLFASTFGKTPDYFIGKTFWDVYDKEHADYRYEATKRVFRTGESESLEVEVPLPDKTLYFYATANPIRDETGKVILSLTHAVDITGRKKIEEALRESEDKYRSLIQYSSDPIFSFNPDETYKFVNESFAKVFGLNPKDITGKSPHFIFPYDEAEKRLTMVRQVLRTGEKGEIEVKVVAQSGEVLYYLTMLDPIKNNKGEVLFVTCISKDITARKLAEVKLQENEELYRNLVVRIPDGVYKSTHDGKFIEANPAMVKMLGYESKEELMDVDIKTQLYFEPTDRESLVLREKLEGLEVYRMKKKDGSEIWVEDHGWYNTDENGEILFHEGILRDVTERKRTEEEIKLKNEQLEKTNAEKDKFFSNIAHDLRSPFNGFLGLTEILVERLQSMTLDEIHNILVNLKNSANNLYSLLGNLLEWSLMQRGLTAFEPQLFLLSPKISGIMALVTEAAKEKGISINYDIPEDLSVFADRNMLESIIRNLSSNAVKFTNKGGGVFVSAKSLPDNSVEISIKDTGIGMGKDITDNLFRLDIDTSRKGTEGELSSGLGLIICKDLIEKHGGKLRVESEEGKGSTFYFTLPERK